MTTQSDETRLEEGAEPSHRGMALVLVLVSFVGFALVGELIMRILWENPYRSESTDYAIKLQIHHANRDLTFDRSLIDPEKPTSRFRTNERSYILPTAQFDPPDATVAFLEARLAIARGDPERAIELLEPRIPELDTSSAPCRNPLHLAADAMPWPRPG